MVKTCKRKKATSEPVEAPSIPSGFSRPEFLRLPKTGTLCPHTGMARSALNGLVLPTPQNKFKPPVKSFVLRQRGAKTGIRLVHYDSLRDYILAHAETGGKSDDENGGGEFSKQPHCPRQPKGGWK